MCSAVVRVALLALLPLSACGQETYPCCVEGLVETCECPRGTNCVLPPVLDNGDGICEMADTGDSASGG
jgi:hypothetical protein